MLHLRAVPNLSREVLLTPSCCSCDRQLYLHSYLFSCCLLKWRLKCCTANQFIKFKQASAGWQKKKITTKTQMWKARVTETAECYKLSLPHFVRTSQSWCLTTVTGTQSHSTIDFSSFSLSQHSLSLLQAFVSSAFHLTSYFWMTDKALSRLLDVLYALEQVPGSIWVSHHHIPVCIIRRYFFHLLPHT